MTKFGDDGHEKCGVGSLHGYVIDLTNANAKRSLRRPLVFH